MRATILLLISFIGIGLTGQNNYLDYHRGINFAEEWIVNEQFDLAEKQIETTLNDYPFRFVKDLVVAAQISLINNHKTKGLRWIRAAIKKGYTLESLKKIQVLKNQLSTKEWATLENDYKDLRKVYYAKIDLDLLKEFSQRYQTEQDGKRTPQYKDIVYDNFNRIKSFIDKNQFPGEWNIGIDYQRLSKNISDCNAGNSKVIVTLLHYDFPIGEIGEAFFLEAIKQGHLHPRAFAIVYTFEKSKVSVLYEKSNKDLEPLSDYKFNFPFGKKIKDLERVNLDRSKFGIVKYEIDLKKTDIEQKYGMKLYFNY